MTPSSLLAWSPSVWSPGFCGACSSVSRAPDLETTFVEQAARLLGSRLHPPSLYMPPHFAAPIPFRRNPLVRSAPAACEWLESLICFAGGVLFLIMVGISLLTRDLTYLSKNLLKPLVELSDEVESWAWIMGTQPLVDKRDSFTGAGKLQWVLQVG